MSNWTWEICLWKAGEQKLWTEKKMGSCHEGGGGGGGEEKKNIRRKEGEGDQGGKGEGGEV